jgi:tetraacyldisaccharide 4'-kinase
MRSGKRQDISLLRGKRAVLLSSIGDPGYFEETVKDLGSDIAEHIIFADHHNYRETDKYFIMRRCNEKSFDLILTTQKDAVKLDRMKIVFNPYPLMVLKMELEITSGKESVIAGLHSLYNS